MKPSLWLSLTCATILFSAQGQGTFIFDQQSATVETAPIGTFIDFQKLQPFVQSFVPSLTSVSFVRLLVADNILYPPSSIYVNLLSDSITGNVMATTATISLRAGAFGYTNFFFPDLVALTPGTTYYLQPVALTGNPSTQISEFYPGGSLFSSGTAQNDDLWFREGTLVPEPSTLAVTILGLAALAASRRRRHPVGSPHHNVLVGVNPPSVNP